MAVPFLFTADCDVIAAVSVVVAVASVSSSE